MKKRSTSQSAFFNLRVLIGLFVALTGAFLALLGLGAFSKAAAQANGSDQVLPRSGPPTAGSPAQFSPRYHGCTWPRPERARAKPERPARPRTPRHCERTVSAPAGIVNGSVSGSRYPRSHGDRTGGANRLREPAARRFGPMVT